MNLNLYIIYICLIFSGVTAIIIPTKFKSKQQAIQTIVNPYFFKQRIKHLEIEKYKSTPDLNDDSLDNYLPLTIVYNKKHKMINFPNLLIPSLKTTEIWNSETNYINGIVNTRLIKFNITLKIIEKEIIYVEIKTKVTSKSIIVPFSNKIIEKDISCQIDYIFNTIINDLGY